MKDLVEKYRKIIAEKIPPESIVTAHDDRGHFYKILKSYYPHLYSPAEGEITYPSVTGMLQILKDESLINYKMNRAIDYVFANWKEFTNENILEHLEKAGRTPADILEDAGDIGRTIHECREYYFKEWLRIGRQPDYRPMAVIPAALLGDRRATSAMLAMERFLKDTYYTPVMCELFVFDPKLKCAGTLDDIGMMRRILKKGNQSCAHSNRVDDGKKITCMECGLQVTKEFYFVLLDVKTSNQFKDHYFFQVGLYYGMFYMLTGLRPGKSYILKLSKEDGLYKLESLKQPSKIASYTKAMIRTNEGLKFIKNLRKDNLKKVAPKMEL